jgi:hypothetical protein
MASGSACLVERVIPTHWLSNRPRCPEDMRYSDGSDFTNWYCNDVLSVQSTVLTQGGLKTSFKDGDRQRNSHIGTDDYTDEQFNAGWS